MRVAVVTPYYKEEWPVLQRCLDSVQAQTHACRHFVVADGHPQDQVAARDLEHFIMPQAHGDNGNQARGHGAQAAVAQGCDVIMFLDADNWFRADHVATIAELHRRHPDAGICTALRVLHRPDGSVLFDGNAAAFNWSHVDFVDTSCLTFFHQAFHLLSLWTDMPPDLGPACDRIMWKAVQARGVRVAHSLAATVHFTTVYDSHYRALGETPPAGAKTGRHVAPALRLFDALPTAEKNRLLLGAGS